ncbi:glycosyltransferase N-terminal domain-containing protein [soil metagenome]
MSRFLYNLSVRSYQALVHLAAPFHRKAAKWVAGREGLLEKMAREMAGQQGPVVWFHCASLGEFEQGRPLMEALRAEYLRHTLVLTFFSPSGYEIRKNYGGAHHVFYLPPDSADNARRFLDLVQPELAVFVKYEFWYHYLKELRQRHIPAISVSAIFRPEQLFFKPYGGFYRGMLRLLTHLFTQNQASADLLRQAGIDQVSVAGDTRFDRVLQSAAQAKAIPLAAAFQGTDQVMVIGSSWPQDMEVLLPFIRHHHPDLRFIIAPHEIHEADIRALSQKLEGLAVRFSQASEGTVSDYRVLLIDNIGLLSSLYAYATYAYIGGAFGKGLHNTLEAAVFGVPLFFGPAYLKFQEAVDLVALHCAFPVQSLPELETKFRLISTSTDELPRIRQQAKEYIAGQAGATDTIMEACRQWLSFKL